MKSFTIIFAVCLLVAAVVAADESKTPDSSKTLLDVISGGSVATVVREKRQFGGETVESESARKCGTKFDSYL